MFNRLLYDLRAKNIPFLHRIGKLVAIRSQTKPKGLTILFIIMDCLTHIGVPQNGQESNALDMIVCRGPDDRRIIWWWETVDAVEIMLLMKEEMRHCVIVLLFASLIEYGKFNEMTEDCLVPNVMDEVRKGWFASRREVDK